MLSVIKDLHILDYINRHGRFDMAEGDRPEQEVLAQTFERLPGGGTLYGWTTETTFEIPKEQLEPGKKYIVWRQTGYTRFGEDGRTSWLRVGDIVHGYENGGEFDPTCVWNDRTESQMSVDRVPDLFECIHPLDKVFGSSIGKYVLTGEFRQLKHHENYLEAGSKVYIANSVPVESQLVLRKTICFEEGNTVMDRKTGEIFTYNPARDAYAVANDPKRFEVING